MVHAVSATYARFERMSPSAIGLAMLLHALVALALSSMSPFRNHPPPTVDPIDVTIDNEPARPEPEAKVEPPPPPAPVVEAAPPPVPPLVPAAPPPPPPPPPMITQTPATPLGLPPPAQETAEAPQQAPEEPEGTRKVESTRQPEEAKPAAEKPEPEPRPQQALAAPEPAPPPPPPPPPPRPLEEALPPVQLAPPPLTSQDFPAPAPRLERVLPPVELPPPLTARDFPKPPPQTAPPAAKPEPPAQRAQTPPPQRIQTPPPHPRPSPLSEHHQAPADSQAAAPSATFVNPAEQASRNRLSDQYMWQVVRKFSQYLPNLREKNEIGTVVVRLVIARDGRLIDAGIARSSGLPILDKAVLESFRAASPYAPLPADLPGNQITFSIPIATRPR